MAAEVEAFWNCAAEEPVSPADAEPLSARRNLSMPFPPHATVRGDLGARPSALTFVSVLDVRPRSAKYVFRIERE